MTIQSIALGVRSYGLKLKQDLRKKLDRKIEELVASFFRWALSKHSVQKEIARAFSGATPLCAVIEKAVDDHVSSLEVSADDVYGLDRWFESATEQFLQDNSIEVESINGFEKAVTDILEENHNEIIDEVVKDLISRLRG